MNCLDCLYLKTIPKSQWPEGTKAQMLAKCSQGKIILHTGEDKIIHLWNPATSKKTKRLHPDECEFFEIMDDESNLIPPKIIDHKFSIKYPS